MNTTTIIATITAILHGIAIRLLSERVIIGLALRGAKYFAQKSKTTDDDYTLADFADALGRPDIALQLRLHANHENETPPSE